MFLVIRQHARGRGAGSEGGFGLIPLPLAQAQLRSHPAKQRFNADPVLRQDRACK